MEVQVPVCVRRFPVDGDVQVAIIPPLEQGVKKGESSVLLHLHSEPDGRSHLVQMGQSEGAQRCMSEGSTGEVSTGGARMEEPPSNQVGGSLRG